MQQWKGQSFNYLVLCAVVGTMMACNTRNKPSASPAAKAGKTAKMLTESPGSDVAPLDCYTKADIDSPDTSDLHTALRKVAELKEVRALGSKNRNTISYCVTEEASRPDSYRIQVGLEDDMHFSTVYLFYVNKYSKEIRILEVVTDSVMSLKDWRRASR